MPCSRVARKFSAARRRSRARNMHSTWPVPGRRECGLDQQLFVDSVMALVGLLTIPPLPSLIGLLVLAAVVVATIYISCYWRD